MFSEVQFAVPVKVACCFSLMEAMSSATCASTLEVESSRVWGMILAVDSETSAAAREHVDVTLIFMSCKKRRRKMVRMSLRFAGSAECARTGSDIKAGDNQGKERGRPRYIK
jgi:hypothetical protein